MTAPTHTHDSRTDAGDDLLAIQQRVVALADPSALVDGVLADLDRLYQDGADPGVLNAIEDSTADLLAHARQLHDTVTATVELARTLRTQREEARQALDELRSAVRTVDTDVPEIEELYEAIEETTMEWLWDTIYEQIYDQIVINSPLHWNEAVDLISLLTEGELADDHPLWNEVREWLDAARRETGDT